MNGRELTDAQISSALRAHLPDRADPGLRERILEAAETTTQQRALPSVFVALREGNAAGSRRILLIAAVLLVALALASVAAVGALRLLQGDPLQHSRLEPPGVQDVVAPSPAPSRPDRPASPAFPRPTGVWIATGSMGTARSVDLAVRLLDGRVLVVGGTFDVEHDTSAELYDPDSGTWSTTGNMLKPHGCCAFPATVLRDGKVLVGDIDDPTSNDGILGVEVYDPTTGTWSPSGKLVTTKGWVGGTTATLLANGNVLVAGSNDAELYDPVSGTWSTTGKMTTPRYGHTATLLRDGRVLVAGGDVPPDRGVHSAELYDPATGSWTAIAKTGFDSSPATLLQDGTVLFLRGSAPALYDPATGTWTPTGDMARLDADRATATLLPDGTVLVARGGYGSDEATAEVFDPATGSWSATGSMLKPESRGDFGPATLLLDGTVLVAGGSVCSEAAAVTTGCPAGATGSAELYVPAGVSPPAALAALPSPTPTPIPTQTPIPTPFPTTAGPVPEGARSWIVTAVNKNSESATVFLAEESENGIGPLCGSVSPNVVPAGVTEKVTFLLPPKSVKSCWIWVEAVPGGAGELFQTSDAPMAGEIWIIPGGEEGAQGGWAGP